VLDGGPIAGDGALGGERRPPVDRKSGQKDGKQQG
jgi:hypothetical protein